MLVHAFVIIVSTLRRVGSKNFVHAFVIIVSTLRRVSSKNFVQHDRCVTCHFY